MNIIPDWFNKLNAEQKVAVETTDGPLLVLSGAGTGKTRVLTSRIAYIIQNGLAMPWQILAVTFTNKAANEMKSRIKKMIGDNVDSLWIGTFHAVGLKILKRYTELAGLKPNFIIFDENDQKLLIKKVMEEDLMIDTKKWSPAIVLDNIARLKDKGFYFDDNNIKMIDVDTINGRLLEIYKVYQDKLKELNAVDFGDLLLYPLMIFEKNPAILEEYQKKFKYIMVDEYQDTNAVQYRLLKLLSDFHHNICCVGDDDQSIYSWRGAEIENILHFENDFENAVIIRLETNYRSTTHILKAASFLISKNKDRLGKELKPCPNMVNDTDAKKIQITGVWTGDEEAIQIVDKIEMYQRKGFKLSEMAILVRAGYQTRLFEERLISAGIPYKIIGGLRFYERQEIKDVIAYLRLLVYPQDNLSFERIINVPKRGVGDKTLKQISDFARQHKVSLFQSTEMLLKSKQITGKVSINLQKFIDDFYKWRLMYNGQKEDLLDDKNPTHAEVVQSILNDSGYVEMWQNSKKVEAEAKLQNISDLLGTIKERFETINEFLEYITLFTESNQTTIEDNNFVSLMTLHAAKGLEFDIVFLPGWEMGIFPSEKSMSEGMASSVEEERRLAYVGLTRAKKVVEIYYAGNRYVFGQWQQNLPSIFLQELPPDNIEVCSFSDAYTYR